ncbi:hypothetical protein BGZ63DRAFT_497166 [Mariannaea sp. PMI_226]|nr:hypothetical protein BGZ63DRAFT_497166 [Mariannaea sp. PMI_226]
MARPYENGFAIQPPRVKLFRDLFPGVGKIQSSDGADIDDKTRPEFGRHGDEHEIRIALLEVEIDQHKETLIHKTQQLHERDCTIKAQSFHVATMHQTIAELVQERTRLGDTITDLQRQLGAFTSQDWQSHNGSKKKRRLGL